MLLGKRILAVVPARSGSKGVRDKNARLIGGKTMIQRAAEVLSVLDWVDFKVISTDSRAYAEMAQKHGLDAPFLRPKHLSADGSGAIETVEHALVECEKITGYALFYMRKTKLICWQRNSKTQICVGLRLTEHVSC